MKRSIITFGLLLSLAAGSTAFAAYGDEPDPVTFQQKIQSQKELNAAIRQRQINYILELRRGHSNRHVEFANHQYNLYRNNVDVSSTSLSRSGEMTTTEGRRSNSNASLAAPNNPKRNFRVRAIDYYVDAGDAGKKVLEENVVLGSEHKVRRNFLGKRMSGQAGYADIVSRIRNLQRTSRAEEGESTNYNPFSYYYGSSSRNYLHPFMKGIE